MTCQPVVVVPAYRESSRVGDTVRAIRKLCDTVIVVDDGSKDGTAEEARSAGADVIVHDRNRGKGVALETGFRRAQELNADVVITLDADGQHDPEDIPSFLRQYSSAGQEVIVGNRMANKGNMPLVRRWTNRLMSAFLSALMRQWVPDTQNGFRLYSIKALPFVKAESRGFAAESEQLLYLAYQGFQIGSVPVRTIYGNEKSKIHPLRDTFRFFNMVARYYRHRSCNRA